MCLWLDFQEGTDEIYCVAARLGWKTGLGRYRSEAQKHQDADKFGDIVEIVGKANTLEDNFTPHSFVKKITVGPGSKPILAINMGVTGQMSRILNSTFGPVTHPLLPSSRIRLLLGSFHSRRS